MNLFLMRHGEPNKTTPDQNRTLTKEGESKLFKAATGWLPMIGSFDQILCSPYKRTRQTSEIIKIIFHYQNEIIIDNNLKPGGTSEYIEEMMECLDGPNILFITHDPELTYHISYFTGDPEIKNMQYGSLAKIAFGDKPARRGLGNLEFILEVK
ncbi:MAG: histidine phosphatase family protein [Rhodothermaceae bacterium]